MRTSLITIAAAALATGVTACAPERSVEAYCQTYSDGMARIEQQHPELFAGEVQDPFSGLASAAGAWGDYVALTDDLEDVAPEDISSDVERVHDTLQKQVDELEDVASNPFGFLIGQFTGALLNSGAFERMATYTSIHCAA
jgi:hypothetical protein